MRSSLRKSYSSSSDAEGLSSGLKAMQSSIIVRALGITTRSRHAGLAPETTFLKMLAGVLHSLNGYCGGAMAVLGECVRVECCMGVGGRAPCVVEGEAKHCVCVRARALCGGQCVGGCTALRAPHKMVRTFCRHRRVACSVIVNRKNACHRARIIHPTPPPPPPSPLQLI